MVAIGFLISLAIAFGFWLPFIKYRISFIIIPIAIIVISYFSFKFLFFYAVLDILLNRGIFRSVIISAAIFSAYHTLLGFFPAILIAYYRPHIIADVVLQARCPNPNNPLDKRAIDAAEKMSLAFGYKNYELRIIDWDIINAMVVSSKDKSTIYVTKGALEKLDDNELENVFAHEFSHIVNQDSFYMTLASIVGGLVVIVAYFLIRMAPYLLSSKSDSKKKGGNLFGLIFLIVGYILAILSPIIIRKLISKLSQSREYLADANAVHVTKYPEAMISVLKKVEAESTKEFIKSKELPQNFTALFFDYEDETHPPIHLRIQKIKEIAGLP